MDSDPQDAWQPWVWEGPDAPDLNFKVLTRAGGLGEGLLQKVKMGGGHIPNKKQGQMKLLRWNPANQIFPQNGPQLRGFLGYGVLCVIWKLDCNKGAERGHAAMRFA